MGLKLTTRSAFNSTNFAGQRKKYHSDQSRQSRIDGILLIKVSAKFKAGHAFKATHISSHFLLLSFINIIIMKNKNLFKTKME